MLYCNFSKIKILPFFVIVFMLLLFSLTSLKSITHAQQPTGTNQIPSDLSLDLNLAEQNPAPDQQQIIRSETKQAQITTTTGVSTTVIPQDTVTPEVKTESTQETVHPDQTTSEQVVTVPVQEQVQIDQNGNPVPTEGGQGQNTTGNQPTNEPTGIQSENGTTGEPVQTQNFVPGTNVSQPDDNAAPVDNSTNPNLPAPTDTVTDQPTIDTTQQNHNQQSNPPTLTPQDNNTVQPTNNSQQNTIPLESQPQDNSNNQSQPTSVPSDNSNNTQQQNQPSSDNSTSGSSNDSGSIQDQSGSSTDNSNSGSSVQGAETGPNPIVQFFQNIIHTLFGRK